ncbi:hypothetical protein Y032_0010g848 [Ancylostoma ceylanicum]|uniref:7TM GPCR serpentine receptor class x (Srx) domain-containing protein n=1 Tax=Ancylostoma ceylanicum TaxID=53326 RepID=A0A016VG60_9BILA|nr:hypothetical protein Y032_0010g848 [Ancylostoma ceylanicum]
MNTSTTSEDGNFYTATGIVMILELRRKNTIFGQKQLAQLRVQIRFYIQGCVSGALLACLLLCYNIFLPFAKTKWALFILGTLAWEITHLLESTIILLFNKPLRSALLHPRLPCCKQDENVTVLPSKIKAMITTV